MSAEVESRRPLPLSPSMSNTAPSTTPLTVPESSCKPNSPLSASSMPPPSQSLSGVYETPTVKPTNESENAEQRPQTSPTVDDTSMQKTPTKDSFFGGITSSSMTSIQDLPHTSNYSSGQSLQLEDGKTATVARSTTQAAAVTALTEQAQENVQPYTNPSFGQQESRNHPHASRPQRQPHSSQDISMDDAEDDEPEDGGSDNEEGSVTSDRPTKKKKGQRFYCTEFPPCQLSFTRSEHLARHIRKHTGERPFQCHCLRRFSRLDNLRQHAQTVHVNENIPGDSLAAAGTRYQRQMRTERMKTPGGRNRASTVSSGSGPHSRGHSRNWSNSSIGSIASDYGSPEDLRRRQQPLAMAQASPSRPMTMETYPSYSSLSDSTFNAFHKRPSSGVSTPASSRFNAALDSPSGLQSPISLMSRPAGFGDRTPSRRLSTPSSTNPSAYSPSGSSYLSPLLSSTASAFPHNAGLYASPTSTVFSDDQRDSFAEAEFRRRTWHPSTNPSLSARPATSGLSYYQTPSSPRSIRPSAASQTTNAAQQSSQPVRLPGIDSFDRAHAQPIAPPRRVPSPMDVDDASSRRSSLVDIRSEARNSRDSWGSINQHLTQLEIDNLGSISTPRDASAWKFPSTTTNPDPGITPPPSASSSMIAAPNYSSSFPGSGHFRLQPPSNKQHDIITTTITQPVEVQPLASSIQLSEPPVTPRRMKRQAWYNGPIQHRTSESWNGPVSNRTEAAAAVAAASSGSAYVTQRTSPEGSTSSDGLPTPLTAAAADYRPAIMHSNGYVEGLPVGGGASSGAVEDTSKHDSVRPEIGEYRPLQPLTAPIPSTATNDAAKKPATSHSNRSPYIETSKPSPTYSSSAPRAPAPALPASHRPIYENTDRLDALVAVATGAHKEATRPKVAFSPSLPSTASATSLTATAVQR